MHRGSFFSYRRGDDELNVICGACVNGTMAAALAPDLKILEHMGVGTYLPTNLNDLIPELREAMWIFNRELIGAHNEMTEYWNVSVFYVGVMLNDHTDMTREEIADFFEALGY